MAEAAKKLPRNDDNPRAPRAERHEEERREEAPREEARERHAWDQSIETLRREWDRAWEQLPARWPFGRPGLDPEPFWRRPFAGYSEPAVDVAERADRYEIFVELPGIAEEDIEVKLSNGVLVVRAEKHGERQEVRKDYVVSERSFGTFQRSLRVPDGVDADRVEAKFDNGVLAVTLPKTKEAQQREKRIPIKPARSA